MRKNTNKKKEKKKQTNINNRSGYCLKVFADQAKNYLGNHTTDIE